jgi:F5/8 type C domain
MLPPAHGNSYGAHNLIDGADDTAWVEGSGGQGVGDFVVLEFDRVRAVRGLTIRNGYAKNSDIYGKNSRVKDVELRFSTGDTLQAALTDSTGEQHVSLNRPVEAKWVQLIIRSVYPGWKYSDTAVNEVRVDAQ